MFSLDKNYRRLQRHLLGGGLALVAVFFTGTIWYRFIEQWSWLEAAYMTVITLSTVGFGETNPLSQQSRLFTIGLIAAGIITIGYIVNRFTEALIQGYFQRGIELRQQKRLIDQLTNHYIVCGFGRMGEQICREFQSESISFVVIDVAPERVEAARSLDYIAIEGNATLDETLMAVKVQEAACIVVALKSDAENLYTILSSKTLNSKIRAIARANTEEAVKKLQRAGADAVVSPHVTGGKRLASAAIRPQVMDFLDGILTGTGGSFYIEEFLLDPSVCPYVGQTLSNARLRAQSGALVLAIRRADGTLIGGPNGDEILQAGDLLFCMGTADQLFQINRILDPRQSPRPPKEG